LDRKNRTAGYRHYLKNLVVFLINLWLAALRIKLAVDGSSSAIHAQEHRLALHCRLEGESTAVRRWYANEVKSFIASVRWLGALVCIILTIDGATSITIEAGHQRTIHA